MRFVLASNGTRGDIEPCVAIGRQLAGRGHDVRMAVPPDLVPFVEAAGLTATAYGPDTQVLDVNRKFWVRLFRSPWRIHDLIRLRREARVPDIQWREMWTTLRTLTEGADLLLFAGSIGEEPAADVTEYYDIPLARLHYFPIRPNGQLLSFLPAPLGRTAITALEWLLWRVGRKFEDMHRRELGLPKAKGPSSRRITQRRSLEIQAYEEAFFPGLAAEWAKLGDQRPFVGALTLELPTEVDEEIASWITAGPPPIFFGFGSIPVERPADTLAMIGAACAQLGQRALVCAGRSNFSHASHLNHVKVVGTMNYAAAFPDCRAVVHHGGLGTTAAGLRAGVPTLILWVDLSQAPQAGAVKRLKVGTARHFSRTTRESLVADLRTILAPQYVARAREIATRMSKPAESVARAADLLENFARERRVD